MIRTHRFVEQIKDSYGNYVKKWGVFEQVLVKNGFTRHFLLHSYDSLYDALKNLNKRRKK
ncbi:MAG: hypothetical protein EB120_09820 [Proteobacteria bacterium]|nr:hypothetical protein [Pseudomonadota bacterium]